MLCLPGEYGTDGRPEAAKSQGVDCGGSAVTVGGSIVGAEVLGTHVDRFRFVASSLHAIHPKSYSTNSNGIRNYNA